MAGRKGLALDFRPAGDVPPIDIDEDKFERILTNLVRNAIKFTERGSIVLTLERRTAAASGSTSRIPGSASRPSICPSSSSASTRSTAPAPADTKGTGIGLTMVKEYVDLMQGHDLRRAARSAGARASGSTSRPTWPSSCPEALSDRRGRRDESARGRGGRSYAARMTRPGSGRATWPGWTGRPSARKREVPAGAEAPAGQRPDRPGRGQRRPPGLHPHDAGRFGHEVVGRRRRPGGLGSGPAETCPTWSSPTS